MVGRVRQGGSGRERRGGAWRVKHERIGRYLRLRGAGGVVVRVRGRGRLPLPRLRGLGRREGGGEKIGVSFV